MECKNLADYTELYCLTDVLLLADVFEAYRDLSLRIYGLDPIHYLTAPSLSKDAMLKVACAGVELLTDQNMYLFFEEGIRGGVSVISGRYAQANNKYMGDQYDESKESSYLMYWDANSLYSTAMLDNLPSGGFRWLSKGELARMMRYPSTIQGCTLEVDLEVPHTKEFHDHTKDYPLAPKNKRIRKVTKLAPHLLNKERYIVHHKAFRCYLENGLILKKIRRGVAQSTVQVVIFDFKKAIDLIDYRILMQKLCSYDILHEIIGWIISLLQNRKPGVKLSQECFSEWGTFTARVPQGTKMRPWLFVILINYFSKYSTSIF